MALRSSIQQKPIVDDPNSQIAATDDGEEIDNTETGGLTKRTFVLGNQPPPPKKRRQTIVTLDSSTTAVPITKRPEEDDLLPLQPLPTSAPKVTGTPKVSEESEEEEQEDDLLSLVAVDAERGADTEETTETLADTIKAARTRARRESMDLGEISVAAEMTYRFPYSKAVVEILPDLPGTFCVRIGYQRGKALLPVFQSTPLRSLAEIRCRGQQYPVFLMQHLRKKRDRILLGAKRKTAKSWRSAVRCAAVLAGKGDKLTWFWRVTATAHALQQPLPTTATDKPSEAVCLALPFAPGRVQVFTLPGMEDRGLVALLNDVAVSIVTQPQDGVLPTVRADNSGIYLELMNADLSGNGTALSWETWLTYAKTGAEALAALAYHMADVADRAQLPPSDTRPFLRRVMETAERELTRNDIIEKRGVDKNAFRIGPHRSDVLLVGPGADAALTTQAILHRYFTHGDDTLQRRARLLTNGICEFQNSIENSPHWGAIWDALVRTTEWGDLDGNPTVSFITTARTAKGLQVLQNYFDVELYERTALAAAQWLLLRMDRDGLPQGERFGADGKPLGDASPWIAGEALIPLVETFRATKNEVYFKTTLRTVSTLQEWVANGRLSFNTASTEQLAILIEGILLVSREYEQPELIAFAQSFGQALRARRLPDGTVSDPTGLSNPIQRDLPLLTSTLAGARAALALSRVDNNVLWPTFALRAVRAADRMLRGYGDHLNVADRGNLLTQSFGVLLSIATRIPGSVADRDKLTVTFGWQTFGPDPATNEYVKVSLPNGDSPDYIALVCQVSKQVLIAVYAPTGTAAVDIVKNGRRPFVKNMLTSEYDQTARLGPLGDGAEGNIGIFLADT